MSLGSRGRWLSRARVERRLAAILAAEITGSMRTEEAVTLALLAGIARAISRTRSSPISAIFVTPRGWAS